MNELKKAEIKRKLGEVATQAAIASLIQSHPDKPAFEKAITATHAWMTNALLAEGYDETERAYAMAQMDARMSQLIAWARTPIGGQPGG